MRLRNRDRRDSSASSQEELDEKSSKQVDCAPDRPSLSGWCNDYLHPDLRGKNKTRERNFYNPDKTPNFGNPWNFSPLELYNHFGAQWRCWRFLNNLSELTSLPLAEKGRVIERIKFHARLRLQASIRPLSIWKDKAVTAIDVLPVINEYRTQLDQTEHHPSNQSGLSISSSESVADSEADLERLRDYFQSYSRAESPNDLDHSFPLPGDSSIDHFVDLEEFVNQPPTSPQQTPWRPELSLLDPLEIDPRGSDIDNDIDRSSDMPQGLKRRKHSGNDVESLMAAFVMPFNDAEIDFEGRGEEDLRAISSDNVKESLMPGVPLHRDALTALLDIYCSRNIFISHDDIEPVHDTAGKACVTASHEYVIWIFMQNGHRRCAMYSKRDGQVYLFDARNRREPFDELRDVLREFKMPTHNLNILRLPSAEAVNDHDNDVIMLVNIIHVSLNLPLPQNIDTVWWRNHWREHIWPLCISGSEDIRPAKQVSRLQGTLSGINTLHAAQLSDLICRTHETQKATLISQLAAADIRYRTAQYSNADVEEQERRGLVIEHGQSFRHGLARMLQHDAVTELYAKLLDDAESLEQLDLFQTDRLE